MTALVTVAIFSMSDRLLAHPEICSQYCDAYFQWNCQLIYQHKDHCVFNCPEQGMTCWCSDEGGITCGEPIPTSTVDDAISREAGDVNVAAGQSTTDGTDHTQILSEANPVVVKSLTGSESKVLVSQKFYLKEERHGHEGTMSRYGIYCDIIIRSRNFTDTRTSRVGPYEQPISTNEIQFDVGSVLRSVGKIKRPDAMLTDECIDLNNWEAEPPKSPDGCICAMSLYCPCPDGLSDDECWDYCEDNYGGWCVKYDCFCDGEPACFYECGVGIPEPQIYKM